MIEINQSATSLHRTYGFPLVTVGPKIRYQLYLILIAFDLLVSDLDVPGQISHFDASKRRLDRAACMYMIGLDVASWRKFFLALGLWDGLAIKPIHNEEDNTKMVDWSCEELQVIVDQAHSRIKNGIIQDHDMASLEQVNCPTRFQNEPHLTDVLAPIYGHVKTQRLR
jgi:hypothetical protein